MRIIAPSPSEQEIVAILKLHNEGLRLDVIAKRLCLMLGTVRKAVKAK